MEGRSTARSKALMRLSPIHFCRCLIKQVGSAKETLTMAKLSEASRANRKVGL